MPHKHRIRAAPFERAPGATEMSHQLVEVVVHLFDGFAHHRAPPLFLHRGSIDVDLFQLLQGLVRLLLVPGQKLGPQQQKYISFAWLVENKGPQKSPPPPNAQKKDTNSGEGTGSPSLPAAASSPPRRRPRRWSRSLPAACAPAPRASPRARCSAECPAGRCTPSGGPA